MLNPLFHPQRGEKSAIEVLFVFIVTIHALDNLLQRVPISS